MGVTNLGINRKLAWNEIFVNVAPNKVGESLHLSKRFNISAYNADTGENDSLFNIDEIELLAVVKGIHLVPQGVEVKKVVFLAKSVLALGLVLQRIGKAPGRWATFIHNVEFQKLDNLEE